MPSVDPRKPRFERTPTRRMVLTPRDLELLRAVHRHRFLRSTHLIALAGGSRQGVLRRLQILFHHDYLDRPIAQLDWYTRGSQPLVYALGKRGAKVLGGMGGMGTERARRLTEHRLSRVFFHHTLAVADVTVAFQVACRDHPDVEFIQPEEVLASAAKEIRGLRLPFRWQVEVRSQGRRERLGVQPDRVFGLRLKGQQVSSAYFFLEADRGTMPVSRRDLVQTSFARKLLAYRETWRQEVHRRHIGIPNFRVLTVTATSERLDHLVAACRSLATSGAGGLFLFATAAQLDGANVLTIPWMDGRGELSRLVEREERTTPRPAALPSTHRAA